MITKKSSRYNGMHHEPITSQVSVGRALECLLRWELGFGGQPTRLDPTQVSVRTKVMAATDDTDFTGTQAEILPLLQAVGLFYEVRAFKGVQNKLVDQVVNTFDGRPFLLAHVGPLFMSQPVARATVAGVLATEEQHFERIWKLSDDNLYLMAEMVLDGAGSLEESLSYFGV